MSVWHSTPSLQRWILVHRVTCDRVTLPPSAGGLWEMSFHEGSALLTCGPQRLWLSDLTDHRLAKAPSGDLFMVDEEENVIPLLPKLQAHSRHELTIQVGRRSSVIQVFRFEQSFVGARLWWSFKSLWVCLALESSMTETQWRETWWPWWRRALDNLGFLSPPHIRLGSPRRACTATPDMFLDIVPTKHLDEASCSSHALLTIACKASMPQKRSTNASPGKKKKNELAWQELLDGVSMNFIDSYTATDIILYLDETVVSEAALPLFGADPIKLPLAGGILELAPHATSTRLGR